MKTTTLLTLALILAGCSSISTERIGEEYPSRPSDWPIAIYAADSAPPGVMRLATIGRPQGKRIARLRVTSPQTHEWSRVLSKVRDRARDVGGDSALVSAGDRYVKTLEVTVYRHLD